MELETTTVTSVIEAFALSIYPGHDSVKYKSLLTFLVTLT